MSLDKHGITPETCYYYLEQKIKEECSSCQGKSSICHEYKPIGQRGFYDYLEKLEKQL